jgi:hypothetical protein
VEGRFKDKTVAHSKKKKNKITHFTKITRENFMVRSNLELKRI